MKSADSNPDLDVHFLIRKGRTDVPFDKIVYLGGEAVIGRGIDRLTYLEQQCFGRMAMVGHDQAQLVSGLRLEQEQVADLVRAVYSTFETESNRELLPRALSTEVLNLPRRGDARLFPMNQVDLALVANMAAGVSDEITARRFFGGDEEVLKKRLTRDLESADFRREEQWMTAAIFTGQLTLDRVVDTRAQYGLPSLSAFCPDSSSLG